jgi:hypothetical protein
MARDDSPYIDWTGPNELDAATTQVCETAIREALRPLSGPGGGLKVTIKQPQRNPAKWTVSCARVAGAHRPLDAQYGEAVRRALRDTLPRGQVVD